MVKSIVPFPNWSFLTDSPIEIYDAAIFDRKDANEVSILPKPAIPSALEDKPEIEEPNTIAKKDSVTEQTTIAGRVFDYEDVFASQDRQYLEQRLNRIEARDLLVKDSSKRPVITHIQVALMITGSAGADDEPKHYRQLLKDGFIKEETTLLSYNVRDAAFHNCSKDLFLQHLLPPETVAFLTLEALRAQNKDATHLHIVSKFLQKLDFYLASRYQIGYESAEIMFLCSCALITLTLSICVVYRMYLSLQRSVKEGVPKRDVHKSDVSIHSSPTA